MKFVDLGHHRCQAHRDSDWQDLVKGGQALVDGLNGDAIPGAKKLAEGLESLYEGLGPAGDGATALADGLGGAVDGVVEIEDGAGDLKSQGTDQLMESGDETASEFAAKVALSLMPYRSLARQAQVFPTERCGREHLNDRRVPVVVERCVGINGGQCGAVHRWRSRIHRCRWTGHDVVAASLDPVGSR